MTTPVTAFCQGKASCATINSCARENSLAATSDVFSPLVPVFRHDKMKAWPKDGKDPSKAKPEFCRYVTVAEAFATSYTTDAHFSAYSVPEMPYRLRLDALKHSTKIAGFVMFLLVIDVDHPWHKEKPRTDEERADLERRVAAWWAVESCKIDALEAAHPGFFVYRSRSGGYRVVYRLPSLVVVRTDEDREAWRIRYQRELTYFARFFGIVGDPACADITRLFRLPRVTRAPHSPPLCPEMRGDYAAIGVWGHEPCPDELDADIAQARALAAEAPAWQAVVRRLDPPPPRARKSKGAPRAPRPPGEANDAPSRLDFGPPTPECGPPVDDAQRARMAAYARATLDAVSERIAAVPGHITGGNSALNGGVYLLARFVPHLLEEREVRARALDAAHRCGVIARDGAEGERHALGTIDSAMRAGMRRPRWPALNSSKPTNDTNDAPLAPPPTMIVPEEAAAALAAALRSPAPFVAIKSTTGAGKSAETRELIRQQLAAGGHRAAVIVPTHALAGQTADELGALRVEASAPVGVARVHLTVLNEERAPTQTPACVHSEAAGLLARCGTRVREELCQGCDARKAHPQTGGDCPAYLAGYDGSPILVLQQPQLAGLLAYQTKKLLGKAPPRTSKEEKKPKDEPIPLVIIDECLPLTNDTPVAGALKDFRATARVLQGDIRARLEPLLEAILRGAEVAEGGETLRDLVSLGGYSPEYAEQAIEDARALDGADLWVPGMRASLAGFVTRSGSTTAILETLARVTRVSALCEAIVDAAHAPDWPMLWIDEGEIRRLKTHAGWVRRVLPYLAAGGRIRILDATAPIEALQKLWGEALEVIRVDVADAPGVVRRFMVWTHAARRRHITGQGPDAAPLAERTRGPLRQVATVATECGARRVGILTDKPLADALRGWLAAPGAPAPAFVPDELAALVAGGVEVCVGHYGAQRGLDTWKEVDLLATLGDPWPNLGAAQAEAASLGLDPEQWGARLAEAELIQAWGRARPVHRTTPVVILHIGAAALAPRAAEAPQWAGVTAERSLRGRPAKTPPSDPSTWPAERRRLGLSSRQHAASLGLSWSTYCDMGVKNAPDEVDPPISSEFSVAGKWPLDDSSGVSDDSGCSSTDHFPATTKTEKHERGEPPPPLVSVLEDGHGIPLTPRPLSSAASVAERSGGFLRTTGEPPGAVILVA